MATTTSVRAVKVEGEGMTVRTRRYECLFPGNWQGAVHMRTKGTTRRKVVFAQDEHGLTPRLPLRRVKFPIWWDVTYTTSEQSWIMTFGMSNQRRAGV